MPKKRASVPEYLLAILKSWGANMSGPFQVYTQIALTALFVIVVSIAGIAATTAEDVKVRILVEGLGLLALLLALYLVWAKERNDCCDLEEKLRPKLGLKFDRNDDGCVHIAPAFLGGTKPIGEMLMIRALPTCGAPAVHNVTGVINGIYKLSHDGDWQQTKYIESLPLSWSIKDTSDSISIIKDKRQYLNVLFVSPSKVSIYPSGSNRPPRAADELTLTDTFRVDVLISSAEGDSAIASIRIKVGKDWKNPEILDLLSV